MSQFLPISQTVVLAVGAAAASITPAPGTQRLSEDQPYCLSNVGSQVVWAQIGGTASIPATGVPSPSTPIMPYDQIILLGPPNTPVSAIASAAGSDLYVQQGAFVRHTY